jgi:hypothetical protein
MLGCKDRIIIDFLKDRCMNLRYQIFLSSTYKDLVEERGHLYNQLNKLGYIVSGMENFPSMNMKQMDFIKLMIDQSDYYVLIVAGMYGSVEPISGKSYTELEYDYAKSINKPIIALIIKDRGKLPSSKCETIYVEKLNAFINTLGEGALIRHYDGKDELWNELNASLAENIRLFPAVGWVRGDQAANPKISENFELLRVENERLKAELEKFKINDEIDESVLEQKFTINHHEVGNVNFTILDMFKFLGEAITAEYPQAHLSYTLHITLIQKINKKVVYVESYFLPYVTQLRNELFLYGIIDTKSSSQVLSWFFTAKGKKLYNIAMQKDLKTIA